MYSKKYRFFDMKTACLLSNEICITLKLYSFSLISSNMNEIFNFKNITYIATYKQATHDLCKLNISIKNCGSPPKRPAPEQERGTILRTRRVHGPRRPDRYSAAGIRFGKFVLDRSRFSRVFSVQGITIHTTDDHGQSDSVIYCRCRSRSQNANMLARRPWSERT